MFICVAEENCADQECVGDIIFACMNGNMQPKIHRSATTYSVLNSISDTLSGRPPSSYFSSSYVPRGANAQVWFFVIFIAKRVKCGLLNASE